MDLEQLTRPDTAFFIGDGEMATLMRATDWSQTALGAVATWPQSLKTVIRIMLTSRHAMWIVWGDSLAFLYNDAYRPILGGDHPLALGKPAQQVWADVRSIAGPRGDMALHNGEALWEESPLLVLERSGFAKETRHNGSYCPLVDDEEQTKGMLCIVAEVTEQTVGRCDEDALQERIRLAELGVEIGVAITARESLPAILQRCSEILVLHLDGALARIWTFNETTNVLELQSSAGLYTHLDGPHSRVPIGRFKIGLIAEERRPHLTNAVIGDPRVSDQEWAKREGMVAFAGYPLLVEDRLVGVMAVFAKHPLSDTTLNAMAAVSHQIAFGIERKWADAQVQILNARLQRAMTETHHRVKNNLQLMSALIDMQRGDGREMVPVSEFMRLSANVRALGVIHDILTEEAKDGSEQETLPAKAVLDKLLKMLQQTSGSHRLTFSIDEVRVIGRQATSLALITNELVSNAQKHGKTETHVTFHVSGGMAELMVEDDGPGFLDDFDPLAASNTGLELIENMAQWDLRGQTRYESRPGGGGRVTVNFEVAQSP